MKLRLFIASFAVTILVGFSSATADVFVIEDLDTLVEEASRVEAVDRSLLVLLDGEVEVIEIPASQNGLEEMGILRTIRRIFSRTNGALKKCLRQASRNYRRCVRDLTRGGWISPGALEEAKFVCGEREGIAIQACRKKYASAEVPSIEVFGAFLEGDDELFENGGL